MINSISSFIEKDHALTQVCLYSIPFINISVRFHQYYHCFDFFKDDDFSAEKLKAFEEKKQRFNSYLTRGIQIQIALSIASFALVILFPPGLGLTLAAHACAAFGAGALSSFLYDRLLKLEIFAPRVTATGLNGSITGR